MRKNESIVARKIHDTYFLIDTKENYSDEKCRLYEINEIGYFLWNNISKDNKDNSLNELTALLLTALDDEIDEKQVYEDVEMFVKSLISMGFVVGD